MSSLRDTRGLSRNRALPLPMAVLVGMGAAMVGLLPWLITEMRLPLQNLWATPTLPDDMPLALLPLNQYTVLALFAMLVLPGALAGITVRRWAGPHPRRTALYTTVGFATVLACAMAQALTALLPGLQPGIPSQIYLAAITSVLLVSFGISITVCRLLAFGTPPAATLAAVTSFIAMKYWFQAFFTVGNHIPSFAAQFIHYTDQYVPAILTGLTLAWCGWDPPRRLLAWAAALLTLWVGTAALEALLAVASTRVELGDAQAMINHGQQHLINKLTTSWHYPVIAVSIAVLMKLLTRRTRLIKQ